MFFSRKLALSNIVVVLTVAVVLDVELNRWYDFLGAPRSLRSLTRMRIISGSFHINKDKKFYFMAGKS